MENMDSIWLIGVLALLAGALIGVLAYRWYSASSVRQAAEAKSELRKTRAEFEAYKASVDRHFDKTSELVNELTQNYVRVYQHLADGAQTLGNSGVLTELLEQNKGRVTIALEGESEAARGSEKPGTSSNTEQPQSESAATPAEAGLTAVADPEPETEDLSWEPADAPREKNRAAGDGDAAEDHSLAAEHADRARPGQTQADTGAAQRKSEREATPRKASKKGEKHRESV